MSLRDESLSHATRPYVDTDVTGVVGANQQVGITNWGVDASSSGQRLVTAFSRV
jgi:hypothetical protein